jgi:cell filamentation protein
MNNRYDTSGNTEGQYQPGSNKTVLLNKPGITNPEDMEMLEFQLLNVSQAHLFDDFGFDQQISQDDLRNWHRRWLDTVYEWAGNYRTVNMSKGDFAFAAAHLIPKLMSEYEAKYLARFTPCNTMNRETLIEALAVCHIEFIIIHPFRDGNGRLGRLLAMIMALQAGMPPLDFEYIVGNKGDYIRAIHAGHAGDYEPIKFIFSRVLDLTNQ